jgi:hypothetical protein
VQRAETFYLPPPPLRPDEWALVPPAELCLRWYEMRQQRRIEAPSGTLLGIKLWARIDAGRWVADCPCGSAQVVTPTDPRFACPECGAGWFAVVFPEDTAAAEAAVASDLPSERFWWQDDDPNPWNRPPDGDESDTAPQPVEEAVREALAGGAP